MKWTVRIVSEDEKIDVTHRVEASSLVSAVEQVYLVWYPSAPQSKEPAGNSETIDPITKSNKLGPLMGGD